MEHRRLGGSGLWVSEISYGNWLTHASQIAEEAATACVHAALDAGITTFDPADVYAQTGAEAVLGQADGYRDLPEVDDGSTTDTLTAARVWVDTDRWRGVPFLLRSGKQMAGSAQRVSLVLRRPEDGVPGLDL